MTAPLATIAFLSAAFIAGLAIWVTVRESGLERIIRALRRQGPPDAL